MYVVFARKYRPLRFEDVVGQEPITRTLRNGVETGRVAQAYLFCGSRGVGKTTVARILAKALNCKDGPTPEPCGECEACRRIATGDDMDVMEIDGASNRGIDEVRSLRQNARLAPAHSRFKLYYIDEVHMLTEPAFNALLKTLEEPPPHVKFIFSTTDPQKMPETVTSRCQRFTFRRIPDAGIVGMLERVCAEEGLEPEPGVLAAVARAARGSLRDALGTLDQLAAGAERITVPDVLGVLGAVDRQVLARMVDAFAGEDAAAALREMHEALFSGTSVEDFADQLSQYLRDLLVASCCGADDPMLAGAMVDAETLRSQSGRFSVEQLTYMIQLVREAKLRARRDTTGRIALELAAIKMARLSDLVPLADALARLSDPRAAPGPATRTQVGGRADAPSAPAPPADASAAASLQRMKERLKKGGSGRAPAAAPKTDAPEGVDDAAFRRIQAGADTPGIAREALSNAAFRKAFVAGDRALGLNPLRLEKLPDEGADQEEADEPEADDE